MTLKSCLYQGLVEHRRLSPAKNEFTYGALYYFLDLDEVSSIFNIPFFMSYNFPGLLSFWRKDYFGEAKKSLKESIHEFVFTKTGKRLEGPVRLLTNISYFGFCFNPASFYYCFAKDGVTLETIVLEVTNTPWNERHQYVMEYTGAGKKVFNLDKEFHVSPFMPMTIDYTWVFNDPKESAYILMQNRNSGQKELIFDATLELKRIPLTRWTMFTSFVKFPLITFKTAVAIYWQALILYFFKKVPFYDHPKGGRP